MSFINNAAQLNSLQPDQEIMLGFEDLLLRELRVTTNPLSLKELQVKISPVRPVTAIIVAASLNRLCRRGEVVKELVGEGRAQYVYFAKPSGQIGFSKGGDL